MEPTSKVGSIWWAPSSLLMTLPWLLLALRVLMAGALILVIVLVARYLVLEARRAKTAASARRPLHLQARYNTLERAFVLNAETWIGRDPNCLICFSDSFISARHARIFWDDAPAAWCIEDAGSRNGTQVNAATVTRVMLSVGDVITTGNVTIVVSAST